jgi:hypothetical protein
VMTRAVSTTAAKARRRSDLIPTFARVCFIGATIVPHKSVSTSTSPCETRDLEERREAAVD